MYQQGYRPPQQPPQSSERKSAIAQWRSFSAGKKAALVALLFLLLLFAGIVISPDVGAGIFVAESVVAVALLIRLAIKRVKGKKQAAKAVQRRPPAPTPAPQRVQREPDAIEKLGYGHSVGEGVEYIRNIRVAGVTFKNGRRHRQTILRQIYWKDEPYNGEITVCLREAEFEGKPAIEVWTNDEQIGYVPKDLVPFIIERFDRAREIYDFDVSGGGKTADGSSISYGASFSIAFDR